MKDPFGDPVTTFSAPQMALLQRAAPARVVLVTPSQVKTARWLAANGFGAVEPDDPSPWFAISDRGLAEGAALEEARRQATIEAGFERVRAENPAGPLKRALEARRAERLARRQIGGDSCRRVP